LSLPREGKGKRERESGPQWPNENLITLLTCEGPGKKGRGERKKRGKNDEEGVGTTAPKVSPLFLIFSYSLETGRREKRKKRGGGGPKRDEENGDRYSPPINFISILRAWKGTR